MAGGVSPLVLLPIFLLTVVSLDQGDVCKTPDGLNGTCLRIANCPPLLIHLQKKPVPQSAIDFLKKSQCRIAGKNPILCCPRSDGNVGLTALKSSEEEETVDVSSHTNLHLLKLDICGQAYKNRIVRGKDVKLNELPWMALLDYTVRSGPRFKCGGSIINDRYVLTAAHCVTKLGYGEKLVSVRLGEYNLSSTIDCEVDEGSKDKTFVCAPYPQTIPIEEAIPHPKYVGRPNYQYDIALVRLSHPANFRPDSVRPVCLPINLSQQMLDLREKKATIAGWGVTEDGSSEISPVVMKATVPIVEHDQCMAAFRSVVAMSNVNQLCAGGDIDNGDACSGDSGGPLSLLGDVNGSSRAIQHGIVSYGPRNCGSPERPVVYTRVGHFMKWILDNMKP